MKASQYFQMLKSGMKSAVPAIKEALAAGTLSVTSAELEKSKNAEFKAFISEYHIPTVEKATRSGSGRTGKITTAIEIDGENSPLHKLTVKVNDAEKALEEELKKFKRTLSPGYIRGEKKETSEPKATKGKK